MDHMRLTGQEVAPGAGIKLRRAEADLRRRLRQMEAVADLGRHALKGTEIPALVDLAVLQVVEALAIEPEAVPELLLLAGAPVSLATLAEGAASRHSTDPNSSKPPPAYTADDAHFLQAIANILSEAVGRKSTLADLQASRDQLHAILEGAADGILVQDVQGNPVYVNDAFARVAGLNQTVPLDKSAVAAFWESFLASDESGRPVPPPTVIALEGKRSPTVTARVRSGTPAGGRWVQYQATPIIDRKGQVTHTVTIAADVTSARSAEEAWRFLADATRALAATLDYGKTLERVARLSVPFLADYCLVDIVEPGPAIRRVVVAHSDPAQEGRARRLEAYRAPTEAPHRIVDAIESGEPQLHTAVSPAVIGEYAYGPDDLAVLRELGFASAMVVPFSGSPRPRAKPGAEKVVVAAKGAVIFVSASSARRYGTADLALAKEMVRSCALAVENAQLFQQVREQMSRYKEIDELRERIISLVSHELKTPLSHIKGFASSLLQTDVTWDKETQRDFLRTIDSEADRLAKLVSDILEISRVQSQVNMDDRERLAPNLLVLRALDAARLELEGRSVAVDAPKDLPAVRVNALHMERVLVNLLENACKYTPARTPIEVSARPHEDGVLFAVKDHGPGIPPNDRQKVFEKFVRLGGSSRQPPGTGLGLTLCKAVVEAHGGKIWVEGGPGEGTVLLFTLPRVGADLPAEVTARG